MSVYSPVVAGLPALAVNDWHTAASLIEHTLLKPDATRTQIVDICQEAKRYGFHLAMVNPANLAITKIFEAENALRQGAQELDIVMNIGALKSGDRLLVKTEIRSLTDLAHRHGALLKLILENALLTQEEKILACALAAEAGVDFVKTSSGLAESGATASDVALMRGVVGLKIGVKAAGGIRTANHLLEMVDAGANRIGTSASVQIVQELGAPVDL